MPSSGGFSQFVSVIVHVDAPGLVQPFTYGVPDGMAIAVGDAVIAPFGSTPAIGHVVAVQVDCPPVLLPRVKPITARIENAAAFNEELLGLARWVAEDTFTDIRDAIRLIAPEIMESHIRVRLRLDDDWKSRLKTTRTGSQMEIAATLAALGGVATPSALAKAIASGAQRSRPTSPEPSTLPGLWGSLSDGDVSPTSARDSSGKAEPPVKIAPILADLRRKGVIATEHEIAPPKARQKIVRVLSLTADSDTASEEARRIEKRAPRQAALLRALVEAGAESSPGLPSAGLAIAVEAYGAARALADKGFASYIETTVYRNPFRIFGDPKDGPPPLTDAQQLASRTIGARLSARKTATLLLHGVTGSGKTEVYLDAVARTLAIGRSALVLVPEIGLTAQLLDLFKARFDDETVAVLHSALSAGERHDEWQRIKSGSARVVLGARSSAFAPLSDLGLIIMDEEHDASYKQDNAPRYHARDVARRRAECTGAVVVLGSATPSLESFYRAASGVYEMLRLSERIDSRPLPPVHVVDLREEFGKAARSDREAGSPATQLSVRDGRLAEGRPAMPFIGVKQPSAASPSGKEPARSIFSGRLADAIRARLECREQVILFLNRRGFATFLLCRDCGHTPACPNCDVSLTYHFGNRLLKCHHCNWERRAPDTCTKCGSLRVRPFGLGTEKVEESVRLEFPAARLLRMDRDTMAHKGAHGEALRIFRRGDADILIGTQMVAKGLDFPNVTLVGVVSADTALNVPDFRSAERAFQLLTQVAGRAGRGKTAGEVIIQTFNPEHESVRRAVDHDYLGFYADEIEHRRELDYPPFAHLANLVVSDPDERHTQVRIEYMASVIRESIAELKLPIGLLGPASCPLARLKNRYRWHMVLRSSDRNNLHNALAHAFRTLSAGDRVCLSVDIDPLTML